MPTKQSVIDEAMKLPAEERLDLAMELYASVDDEIDPDAEAAWEKEIAKRLAEYRAGKVKPIPWSVARQQIGGGAGEKR